MSNWVKCLEFNEWLVAQCLNVTGSINECNTENIICENKCCVLKFVFLTTVKSTTSIESVVFVSHVEFFSFTHCDTFFSPFIHSNRGAAVAVALAAAIISSCCCLPLCLLLIVGVVVHSQYCWLRCVCWITTNSSLRWCNLNVDGARPVLLACYSQINRREQLRCGCCCSYWRSLTRDNLFQSIIRKLNRKNAYCRV